MFLVCLLGCFYSVLTQCKMGLLQILHVNQLHFLQIQHRHSYTIIIKIYVLIRLSLTLFICESIY